MICLKVQPPAKKTSNPESRPPVSDLNITLTFPLRIFNSLDSKEAVKELRKIPNKGVLISMTSERISQF